MIIVFSHRKNWPLDSLDREHHVNVTGFQRTVGM